MKRQATILAFGASNNIFSLPSFGEHFSTKDGISDSKLKDAFADVLAAFQAAL
jgi:hypothetical protein